MIIKVKETTTTEREIEINLPLYTYDKETNKYYYNYTENKCMILDINFKSINNWEFSNYGLQFEEIKKETFYLAFDSNIQNILEILNK